MESNACGNCTGTCVDKGCPTGYSPTNPGGCPDTALSGDGTFTCYGNYKKCTCPDGTVESCGDDKKSTGSVDVGDTTCHTCVDKTCSDYGYKDKASCSTGKKAVTKIPRTGLTCYNCVEERCSDYGYQSSFSCSTGYMAKSVSVGNGLSCYDCIQDAYSDSGSDAISDGISNGSGGGSLPPV